MVMDLLGPKSYKIQSLYYDLIDKVLGWIRIYFVQTD